MACSQFPDIFDVDYFITSLRDEVRILRELPPAQKKKVEEESLFSMPPISWSNMTYYYTTVGFLFVTSRLMIEHLLIKEIAKITIKFFKQHENKIDL